MITLVFPCSQIASLPALRCIFLCHWYSLWSHPLIINDMFKNSCQISAYYPILGLPDANWLCLVKIPTGLESMLILKHP